jgi:signal transduction histidine kinase
LVLTEPVHLGVHSIATASVAFSQRQLNEVVHQRLARLQRRLAEVALVSLALGLVLCFWMALSWTRPIGFLAQMAERIGQGRWRLEWGPAELRKDELGFLARAFHRMADRLRELDQLKEDFVSAVTHELRSPLGAIESYLNLIGEELHEGISPETWQNYLQRLRANTQRLTRFVNDLLDVAALERGKVTLERRSTDALALVREVIDLFAAKLKEKNLSCELEASASLPPVFADADKLRQVLINLVSNAIKFTPEGGHILMKAEALEAKKLLQISVTDTGIGIAEGDQAKIFSKFEQVLTARQGVKGPKGTGLGLAISRMLIEMQGGTLGVHSQLGEGSTFFFTLPLAESGASARAQPVLPKGT